MRTVVEDPAVTYKIYAEAQLYPRLEEAFEALQWWLAHEPDSGILLDDIHWIYTQSGNHHLRIPTLVVVYTFDAHTVTFLHLLVRLPPP